METKEFNLNDLSDLKNIPEAIRKIDEVLDGVAPYFIKCLEVFQTLHPG